MERLTSNCGAIDSGNTYYPRSNFATGELQQSILNRLGAYEDTGLTPEEIMALKESCGGDMKVDSAIEAIMCRKEAAAANLEKFKLQKDRDTLKKALELACDSKFRYMPNPDYFIQQVQEERKIIMRVTMTMKEYEELKRKAQWFDEIKTEIRTCTNQHWTGDGDDMLCTLAVNVKRTKKLLFDYAATDCELDGYTEDTIAWDGLNKQEATNNGRKF